MIIHYLKEQYGDQWVQEANKEIIELKRASNIPFTEDLVNTGISFMAIKSGEIKQGKKAPCSLKSLISESFGEATIYKYNIQGSV